MAGKVPISIRLDRDVLKWFEDNYVQYQTQINVVLRACMEHAVMKEGK